MRWRDSEIVFPSAFAIAEVKFAREARNSCSAATFGMDRLTRNLILRVRRPYHVCSGPRVL